ncbi:hypothetical protein Moror_13817 [Moniliophthora roreri MCA 2997]|uniref:Uncharacterized protein n=1 Tax=Moniliophthora roreri (strain MCA 2997) TaxID=1381753 RepID=V2XRB5_MONRO|nr:hypothetical protein Moror_13817 [Moniliophthora roreri MCA 2997]
MVTTDPELLPPILAPFTPLYALIQTKFSSVHPYSLFSDLSSLQQSLRLSQFPHLTQIEQNFSGLISLSILLVTLALAILRWLFGPRHTKAERAPQVLRCSNLTSFLVPTKSRITGTSILTLHPHWIALDVTTFLKCIICNILELRDPSHLQLLFQNRLYAGKLSVSLLFGIRWRIRIFHWCMMSYADMRQRSIVLPSELYAPDTLHLLPPIISPSLRNTLCLDFIPQSEVESILRNFLHSLPLGTQATIEFTARDPHIPFMSDSFLTCALPFMLRYQQRTSAPLFVSLTRVIDTITDFKMKILSVTNESDEYAQELYTRERDMLIDRALRTRFIQQHGETVWREHRLMVVWEAGLHATGLLNRWVVVFRK